MPKLLADYKAETLKLVRDGAGVLSPPEYDGFLLRALEQYSKRVPREVVVDVAGDGTGDFALSSLTGFDEEFSGDPLIEYPISTEGEPTYIDRRDWIFYRKPSPTGKVIRLLRDKPAASENVRFTFKAVHSVTAVASTVPESDFYAVCKLAAAEACEDLSRHFTETSENTIIEADQAVYQSKADEYEKRAKRLREQANAHFGAGKEESSTPAASVTQNWDTQNSLGGERLTHRRRHR